MERKCERLYVKDFLDELPSFCNERVEFYIDVINKDEILNFLLKKKKKTRRILYEIFSLRYVYDLYDKEEVSDKAKNITAMKFKSRSNERIYCREFFIEDNTIIKKVVMITLYCKNEMDKKTKKMIENIGDYNYGF